MSETLRIGSQSLDPTTALAAAEKYLTSDSGVFAYPSYDGYDTGSSAQCLSDGDLLASVLLNARVSIRGFESLRAARPALEKALRALPSFSLLDATDEDVAIVAALYAPLDAGMPGVGGTILSKVLHRKRPDLIPLYDSRLYGIYVSDDGPVQPARRGQRTWVEFMIEYTRAIRDDLLRHPNVVELATAVAGLATRHPITVLRAWDILAWQRAGLVPVELDGPED